MSKINKKFEITTQFTTKAFEDTDDLIIEGIANASTKDRDGDIIITDAWKGKALANYSKNPIILAYHDHKQPIGKAIDYIVDDVGLHISAKISKSAGRVYDLIKQGILQTFSVGFQATDIDYDEDNDLFVIKALELYEISVVSIPANAGSSFSVRKTLGDEDYNLLKSEFVTKNKKPAEQVKEKTIMTDKVNEKNDKLQKQVDGLSTGIAALLDAQAKREQAEKDATVAAEKAAKEATEKAAKETATKNATAAKEETTTAITAVSDGAAKLITDLEARLAEKDATIEATLKEFKDDLESKNADLLAMRKSKMEFDAGGNPVKIDQKEINTAVMLGKMMGKPASETKFGAKLSEKILESGNQLPNPGEHMELLNEDWEQSFSTTIYNDIRQQLIIEPMFGNIPMNTASLTLPINPEAGYGEWITRAAFENDAARVGGVANGSTGAAQKHLLTDITLIAQKLAAKEYIGYEEEEDTILPIVSVIQEAITRRMSKTSDAALLGTQPTGAPVTPFQNGGLIGVADTNSVLAGVAGNNPTADILNVADLGATRRLLGNWGLSPSDVIYIVSADGYYDLLEDDDFRTMDVVGTKATILTGQIGMVLGSPVVVSGELEASGLGAVKAIALNKSNFKIGTLRGLMTERDRDIVAQQNVIVSTRRMDFKDIITGQGVALTKMAAV